MSKSPDRSGIMSLLTDEEYIEHLARRKAALQAQHKKLEAQHEKLLTGAVGVAQEYIGLTDNQQAKKQAREKGRKESYAGRDEQLQAEAETLWSKNRGLSKIEVGRRLSKKLNGVLSAERIRKIIEKPSI